MRRLVCAANVLLIVILASIGKISAQAARGSVTGVISGPNGAAASGAGVQAKNVATGAFVRTISKPDGGYALTNIPPGTYEISVNMPCCAFQPFVKSDVVVNAGPALKLEPRVESQRSSAQ